MFWTKRVVIGDGERGLVYRNRRFERVLDAGVYRMFDPLKRIEVSGAGALALLERLTTGKMDKSIGSVSMHFQRLSLTPSSGFNAPVRTCWPIAAITVVQGRSHSVPGIGSTLRRPFASASVCRILMTRTPETCPSFDSTRVGLVR